jgi:hypothetical protein
MGDARDVDETLGQAIGKVKIFRPGQDPEVSKPQMMLKAKVGGNLGPVLHDLAIRYSPIKSKCPR